MTKDEEKREKAYRQAVKEIEEKLDEGKDVACLTLGDVSVYSTFMYMYKLLIMFIKDPLFQERLMLVQR